uniref:NAC domain-containing protein 065 n=1 Tax=Setaria italica TaxID=4555 RepID=A0A220QT66_SETIT|nr:NAC domain-containing protein 065 [Setaria italica]
MGEAEASAGGSLEFRGCQLPPGFRFQPTDQEIIVCYLKKKIDAATAVTSIIADVDIYKFDPWDLPDKAAMFGDGEWFFFSPRDRKYPNGARPNRRAGSGYWKATGTDKPILASGRCLGVKKALVFYQGRSPKGTKTHWVMHEYRLLDAAPPMSSNSMRLDDWVLCRVRNKQQLLVPDHGYSSSSSEPTTRAAADIVSSSSSEVVLPDSSSAAFADIHWNSDDHLLRYLIGGGGSGNPSTASASAVAAGHHDNYSAPPPHPHALVSVLESIKRNLSFQAIDELYLLQPPSKRANCIAAAGDDDDDHIQQILSPTSFSISEADEMF